MQQQINQMLSVLATGLGGIKHLQQQKQQTEATEAQTEAIKANTQSLQEIINESGEREVGEFMGNVAALSGFEEGSKLDLLLQKAAQATSERYNADQMIAARKDLVKQLRDAPAGVTQGIVGTKKGYIKPTGGNTNAQ